jgi:hypothetical protein
VLHALPLSPWLQDGAHFGEEGVQLGLDGCLVEMTQLRSRAQKLLRDLTSLPGRTERHNRGAADAQSLVAEARSIDDSLAAWAAALPEERIYTATQMTPERLSCDVDAAYDERFYGSTVETYPSFEHATMWNCYRAARIVTNNIIAKALPHTKFAENHQISNSDIATQQQLAQLNIQTVVDEICASVPFYFGRVGRTKQHQRPKLVENKNTNIDATSEIVSARKVFPLAWPLIIAIVAVGISERQRRWVRAQLLLVSQITGKRVLKGLANVSFVHQSRVVENRIILIILGCRQTFRDTYSSKGFSRHER